MRIGIPIIGSAGWQGGVVYVHNLLRALRGSHAGKYQAFLIADDVALTFLPAHQELLDEGLADGLIHVGERDASTLTTLPYRRVAGWDGVVPLVDVVYPAGWGPIYENFICWIPDFQYHHLPQFSPPAELEMRYRQDAKIAACSKRVVFSSENARSDFRALFPRSRAQTRVVHFHSSPPADLFQLDGRAVAERYGCPADYLICSNQFWTHKNHRVAFDALRTLWERGWTIPLICTGSPSDYRNSGYYDQLQTELAPWNTRQQIRFLGLIPRADQLQLLRQARAVIQPSLFEGWSTVVEDARSLGLPMFLSDIAVHREQDAPHAHFFPPTDPTALAELIQRQLPALPPPGPAREQAGHRHTAALVSDFGEELFALFSGQSTPARPQSTVALPIVPPIPPPGLSGHGGVRPLIATSIAPKNLQRQTEAVASWRAQGFDVVSVNCAEEIQQLQNRFPDVVFRVSTRDARALAGKPLVPLDDLLDALRSEDRPLYGIVNSDIVLRSLGATPLAVAAKELAGDGLAFAKRIDQETESAPGEVYDGGIDVFFFGAKLLAAYPSTPFFVGLPWWDYFFAAFPPLTGHPTVEITEPIAFHLTHPSFYDLQKHWIPLGIESVARLAPLFQQDPVLLNSSGMDTALGAIQRVMTEPPAKDDLPMMLELAILQFARATIQWLKEALAPRSPSRRPSSPLVGPEGGAKGLPRLRLGVPVIADAGWMGGVQHIIHLVAALSRLPPDEKPEISLIVRNHHASSVVEHAELLPLVDQIISVGFDDNEPRHARRLVVSTFAEIFQHIDALFPAHTMAIPGRPVASWIPDFQHLRLPDMFIEEDRKDRDDVFGKVAEQGDLLVVSSQSVRRDWERFFPKARPIVRVLPFRAVPDARWFALDPAAVAAKYGLTEPFLICGNQFWIHKGHATLIDAVGRLVQRGIRPFIVCTGVTDDYRVERFFDIIRARMEKAGVTDRFRVLGLLPRDEQIALMRRSLAVVQPSLFEGWSTVVEDARALGKDIILSDIDVHQEQAPPHAHYYAAGYPKDLERVLADVLPKLVVGPVAENERVARTQSDALVREYARGVCAVAREAAALHASPSALASPSVAPVAALSSSPVAQPALANGSPAVPARSLHDSATLTAPVVSPLATTARHRLLAWPRYDRPADLAALVNTFGPVFGTRDDVCLCLRHDRDRDIPLDDAIRVVTTAFTEAFGDTPFDVLMVDDVLDDHGWTLLAAAVTDIIALPWSWTPERHARLAALGAPIVTTAQALHERFHQSPGPTSSPRTPPPAAVRPSPPIPSPAAPSPAPAVASPVQRGAEVLRQARSLVERGELATACQLLITSMELALESPELLLMLADIFVAQGKPIPAAEILQQASLLHPRNSAIASHLTQLLATTASPPSNGRYAR